MNPRLCAILLTVLPALAGCFDNTYVKQDRTDRRPRVLAVTDHDGGTHECLLLKDRLWYVGQGPRLLVLEGRGTTVRTLEAGPVGHTGPLVDLAIHRGDLVGVLWGDAVVRWDLANPRLPVVIDRVDAAKLGIEPRAVSVVGSELYVSGEGGVVRASDGRLFLKGETPGPVVPTTQGLAAVCDRRVRLLESGVAVGVATDLQVVPDEKGLARAFAFALGAKSGSQVGLMGLDLHEHASDAFHAPLARMRVTGDRLWLLGEDRLATWKIEGDALVDPTFAKVKGVRDVAALGPNLYAMVGSFGRAIYRLHDDRDGPGDEFTDVKREPGRMDQALFDGRRIVAGSVEGFWLYPIRGTPTITDKSVDVTTLPEKKATFAWGTATIDAGDGKPETPDELRSLRLEGAGGNGRWEAPRGARIACVAAVDGQLWVGHTRGITVLRQATLPPAEPAPEGKPPPPPVPQLEVVGEVRIPGTVTWMFPLRTGGGVAWVSRTGGMGVCELVPEGEEPKRKPAD